MHILAIGASRNIGYHATRSLLAEGHTVTYLLRKPEVFDDDHELQTYLKNGRAKVVKGDATVRQDIQRAFAEARTHGKRLDVVLFTVGGKPYFSATKGFFIKPANLCSYSLLNVLTCYSADTPEAPQPKLIIVSSNGLTDASHSALPLVMKPLLALGAKWPHADKLVMERVVFQASNWMWPQADPVNTVEFLGDNWKSELREPGFLKEVTVIRPSVLVDGGDSPAKGAYRTSVGELKSAYTISRKEVAHFIVEGVLKHWGEWKGKIISITSA